MCPSPRPPYPPVRNPTATLTLRLLANTCELCGSEDHVEMHFERRLMDLQRGGQAETSWGHQILNRHRKSLVVCEVCQQTIHA